ncbi:histone H2B-like [Dermacentor variabilis]|uniref:histone H2B-like n=1 Tax=Dermacentor variabilis TaxID=34621 RepID=UPI003F5B548F
MVMPPQPSGNTVTKFGKAPKNVPATEKEKKHRRKKSLFIYIHEVLKQVHPDTGVSSNATSIMHGNVNDIFECTTVQSRHLLAYNRSLQQTFDCLHTALCLLLPGERALNGVGVGNQGRLSS